MTEGIAPPPSGQEAPDISASPILGAIKANFAIVSGVAIASGVALSTLFLFSYLSVFDWHLIWLVQYVDVISFGLVALGILGSSILVLNPYFYMWINAKSFEPRSRKRWIIAIGILVVALLGWQIWTAVRNNEGYFHIITGVVVAGAVVFLIWAVLTHVRAGRLPNSLQVVSLVLFVLIVTYQSGRWLADMVLETNWFVENVRIKDQTLNDAKLVIVMSRFTVFLKDNVLHVYPTADIAELQTAHKLQLIP